MSAPVRRIRATRTPQGEQGAYAGACPRCGIERGPDARRGSLCRDCRDADPRWGRRFDPARRVL